MIDPRLRIALNTFFLYAVTFAIGIVAAFRHAVLPEVTKVMPLDLTFTNALIFIGVFFLCTFIMVRFFRLGPMVLRIVLFVVLAAGSQFVLAAWLPWTASVIGALAVVILLQLAPMVIVHDLAIALGIAGIGGLMGLSIPPVMAAVLLAVLSLYDIISVYRTGHMVALAGRMVQSGSVIGFLVPVGLSGFFMRTRQALDAQQVMMLGSGDIALPLILATSAIAISITASMVIAAFTLVGVMVMYWIFMHQEQPMPMAALPPIAASAILGLLVVTLFHL